MTPSATPSAAGPSRTKVGPFAEIADTRRRRHDMVISLLGQGLQCLLQHEGKDKGSNKVDNPSKLLSIFDV